MSLRPASLALPMALSLLLVAGCDRAPEAPATDAPVPGTESAGAPAPAPAAPAGEVDATRVVDHAPVAGAGADFDVRAFAGAFEADGTQLVLAPDGTYALAMDAGDGAGTWSVEADGARIRLDPDSKAEADRVYTLVSADELVSDDDGRALRRAGD